MLDLCNTAYSHGTGENQRVGKLWSHSTTTASQVLHQNLWTSK
jgi:hypothetical protein